MTDRARQIAYEAWIGRSHEAQDPPADPWGAWLFLGGRGAGKTRAGAEWLQFQAGWRARLALVGPTLHAVREVMIEGPSGLKAVAPRDFRPIYRQSRRRVEWPSGAVAYAFSAEDPRKALRGPHSKRRGRTNSAPGRGRRRPWPCCAWA